MLINEHESEVKVKKVIVTNFAAITKTRPTRIIARDFNRRKFTITNNLSLTPLENHTEAFQKLHFVLFDKRCEKFIIGRVNDGYVFLFD